MNQNEKNKIQSNLTIHMQEYTKAIIEKYGKYIPQERLTILNNIKDFGSLIRIYNYGSVNAFANDEEIKMPLCADRLLNIASKIPGYGINKKHQNYNSETLISNNNTYINYIFHAFVSGTNTEGYYDDMLLHETMHFCGSGGSTALKEGINELLTRKLALEKGFRTNGCGYPKEVKVALLLQNIFGEEILDQIAFINSEEKIYIFLTNVLGIEAAKLYIQISQTMEKEFNEKYYASLNSYNGLIGILIKTLNYNKINYSSIYKMLDNYSLSKQVNEHLGIKNR